MSFDTPAGIPSASPAALIVEGDSLATLRRIGAALPALREAAGKYAPFCGEAADDWKRCRAWLETGQEKTRDPLVGAAIAYGDALALAEDCKRQIRADAAERDADAVRIAALAVARRSFRWDGSAQLPETAEAEIEIEQALNPPAPSHDWQRDRAEHLARVCAARGESENSAPWICLYSEERHEGGPEEGGWCYDWREAVACWRTADYSDPRDAHAAALAHARERGFILRGDEGARPLSSVCPHNRVNAIILREPFPFASVSVERPRYE